MFTDITTINSTDDNVKKYTFDSKFFIGEELPQFSEEFIKNETMFFSCGHDFVKKYGGPISIAFLSKLPPDWANNPSLIIDSRVHMLMPGWYPAIPGFHHDAVIRSRQDGQPNYDVENKAQHILALINGDICPTEFATGKSEFNKVPLGEKIYKKWHEDVIKKIKNGELKSHYAPSNKMIHFDWQAWHQGSAAVKNGWRWFMRASINDGRIIKNEIRRQTQIYLSNPMEGW